MVHHDEGNHILYIGLPKIVLVYLLSQCLIWFLIRPGQRYPGWNDKSYGHPDYNATYIVNIYCMQHMNKAKSYEVTLIFHMSLWDKYCYYHFQMNKLWHGEIKYCNLTKVIAEQGFDSWQPESYACSLNHHTRFYFSHNTCLLQGMVGRTLDVLSHPI